MTTEITIEVEVEGEFVRPKRGIGFDVPPEKGYGEVKHVYLYKYMPVRVAGEDPPRLDLIEFLDPVSYDKLCTELEKERQ